jgi:hypothetical protein
MDVGRMGAHLARRVISQTRPVGGSCGGESTQGDSIRSQASWIVTWSLFTGRLQWPPDRAGESSRACGIARCAVRSKAAVSRLEPGIRARKMTRDVRGRSLLVRSSSSVVCGTTCGGSASALSVVKAAGRAGSPAGRLPFESEQAMHRERDQPKRAKGTPLRTPLANSRPRERTWTEQAPTPDEDGGKPMAEYRTVRGR